MTLLSEIYDVVYNNRGCCGPRATLAQNFMTDHDYNCEGQGPTANFTVDVAAGNTPATIQFTDTSSGDPTSWLWDFGDGTTSTEQNPNHVFTSVGNYSITLTVTAEDGSDAETKTNLITVVDAPVAKFTADTTVGVGSLTTQFTDTSTGSIGSYLWNFGDGSTSTAQNPSHTYSSVGSYTVTLTVTDAITSATDLETKTNFIKVNADPPVANFTSDKTTGGTPLEVQFTGQTVGTITSYAWTFGDGETSTEQSPLHEYDSVGTYTVSFTATGPGGQDTETKTNYITVVAAPVAAFTSDKTSGYAPSTVQFTDQSTGPITSYLWNFGDGTTSVTASPSHIYTTAGTYSISLTVTGPGGQDVETKTNFMTIQPSLIEGGGFYVGDLNGYRIICAPIEGETTAKWKKTYTETVGADSLTDGYQNTADMIAAGAEDHPAAKFCNDLTIGGFTDWYLPSKDELNLLYQNHTALEAAGAGTFNVSSYYWSSSEYDTSYAWSQFFIYGNKYYTNKPWSLYVRAIRRLPLV